MIMKMRANELCDGQVTDDEENSMSWKMMDGDTDLVGVVYIRLYLSSPPQHGTGMGDCNCIMSHQS